MHLVPAAWQTDRLTDGRTDRQAPRTSVTIVCISGIWRSLKVKFPISFCLPFLCAKSAHPNVLLTRLLGYDAQLGYHSTKASKSRTCSRQVRDQLARAVLVCCRAGPISLLPTSIFTDTFWFLKYQRYRFHLLQGPLVCTYFEQLKHV